MSPSVQETTPTSNEAEEHSRAKKTKPFPMRSKIPTDPSEDPDGHSGEPTSSTDFIFAARY